LFDQGKDDFEDWEIAKKVIQPRSVVLRTERSDCVVCWFSHWF